MALSPIRRARLQATFASVVTAALWFYRGTTWTAALAGVAACLACWAWVAPRWYEPVQRGLDHLSRAITKAVSWLLLGVVYFGVFAPVRVFIMVLRRDPLQMQFSKDVTSYLRPLPPAAQGHFERQF